MKKTLATITLLGTIISSYAFAKTSGHYIGLDFINSEIDLKSSKTATGRKITYNDEDANKNSFSINYKYAFNFDNFFIAPGVFFDYSNVTRKYSLSDDIAKNSLNYRYAAKFDVGYDINDVFAPYLFLGAANNNYTFDAAESGFGKKSGNDFSLLYGIGAKFSVSNNIDLNLGYELSKFTMKAPDNSKGNFDLRVIRVGATYKF